VRRHLWPPRAAWSRSTRINLTAASRSLRTHGDAGAQRAFTSATDVSQMAPATRRRRTAKPRKAAMTITKAAARRIQNLLDRGTTPGAQGIQLGVKQRGCNGLTYTMGYCVEKQKFMEEVEEHGVKVFIEPKALMFLIGTEMDFVDDRLRSEFVFHNPNSKGECGCGESFNV